MLLEAALITLSCVLFVQMGLADAVCDTLRIKARVITCPKCATFWTCLIWTICRGNGVLWSVAVSFVSSYLALWLALLYDALAALYNDLYATINKQTPASEVTTTDPDAVP